MTQDKHSDDSFVEDTDEYSEEEHCHWCGSMCIPVGHQIFTGRAFCSYEHWDEYKESERF